MVLFKQIKILRKEKKWSQAELGNKIGGDARQISRYENGKIIPSAETIVKIAKVFDVSTDYLLLDNAPRKAFDIEDPILLKRVESLQALGEEDKACLFHIIDAFLTRNQIKSFAQALR